MDEYGERRVRANQSGAVDWISDLPDSLLCQVLLKLNTKDVVKTSILSPRWKNLWKSVPGLDLENSDFPNQNTFVSFVDTFLGFNNNPRLQSFKLNYESYGDVETDIGLIKRWINTVVDRKVKLLCVLDESSGWDVEMPPSIYTCESLVCLKLSGLTLPAPMFVSLPSLKVINLSIVNFANDLALETFISSCPVLESLFIEKSFNDNIKVLRVRSQSLLSFTHVADGSEGLVEDLVVSVDAPRLEFLNISDARVASFIINNPSSLLKADIDTEFNLSFGKKFNPNDLPKKNMIRNFLVAISSVINMTIVSNALKVTYTEFVI